LRDLYIFVVSNKKTGGGHLSRQNKIIKKLRVPCKIITLENSIIDDETIELVDDIILIKVFDYKQIEGIVEHDSVLIFDPPYYEKELNTYESAKEFCFLDRLRQKNIRVIYFTDEFLARTRPVSLVVNGYLESEELEEIYSRDGADSIVGIDSFLFSYDRDRDVANPDESCKKVFINFGYFDQHSLASGIREVIRLLSDSGCVVNFVGQESSLTSSEEILNLNIFANLKQKEFLDLLAKADLAIVSAGNVNYERMLLGVPGISIPQFGRQAVYSMVADKLGVSLHLDSLSYLKSAVTDWIEGDLSRISQQCIRLDQFSSQNEQPGNLLVHKIKSCIFG